MKQTLEKLISQTYIDLDDFYVIRVSNYGETVYLQGWHSIEMIEKYQKLGLQFTYDYINFWHDANELEKDGLTYKITFTERPQ